MEMYVYGTTQQHAGYESFEQCSYVNNTTNGLSICATDESKIDMDITHTYQGVTEMFDKSKTGLEPDLTETTALMFEINQVIYDATVPKNSYTCDVGVDIPGGKTGENTLRYPSEVEQKSVRLKRKRRKKVSPEDVYLPPCRVCGDVSSGFHYGANTCEACKGFFRRTLKGLKKSFQCKCTPTHRSERKQDDHVINGCALCRYNRCIQIGMSKEAIKIGRYTSVHRTQNTTEIKTRTSTAVKSDDEKLDVSKDSDASSPGSTFDTVYLGPGLSSPDGIFSLERQIHIENATNKTERMKLNNQNHNRLSQEEIDHIVTELNDAHIPMSFLVEHLPKEDVDKKHKEYLEEYNLKKELFGNMKALPKEEYVEFYNATGIDIDGRHNSFQRFFQTFQKRIKNMIRFSKYIPGFKDLSQIDQINLIKHSRAEAFLLSGYREVCKHINLDLCVLTTPWEKVLHFEEGQNIFPLESMRNRVHYCQKLIALKLSDSEDALLRAIVMTFTDRCDLEDPQAVQCIQDKLIACLEHSMDKRSTGSRKLYYKIMDTLINFRDFTEKDKKVVKDLLFSQIPDDSSWVQNVIL